MTDKPISRSKRADPAPSTDGKAVPVHTVRGERIILDSDLAELYGTETRVFNQAFKRQRERGRFPSDWAFELTETEVEDLRSQNVISSGGWGVAARCPGRSPSTAWCWRRPCFNPTGPRP